MKKQICLTPFLDLPEPQRSHSAQALTRLLEKRKVEDERQFNDVNDRREARVLTWKDYNEYAQKYFDQYESTSFINVHRSVLELLPEPPGIVLDIGSGSGRDARYFVERGFGVHAVEPAGKLRELAKSLDSNGSVTWLDDSLPLLKKLTALDSKVDLIWLSAIWMHILPEERNTAIKRLKELLTPTGKIFISLRHGQVPEGRVMYKVSLDELVTLTNKNGLKIVFNANDQDKLNRSDIWWESVLIEHAQ